MNRISIALIILTLLTSCQDKEKREKALRDLDAAQQTLVNVHAEIQ